MHPTAVIAFFGMGDQEILLVMAVILIFFGGSKMPELAKGLGKALREFRRATSEVEREFKRVMEEAEHETIAPFKDALETPPHTAPADASALTANPPSPAEPLAASEVPPVEYGDPPRPEHEPAANLPLPPASTPPPQPAVHDADEFHSDI